MPFFYFGIFLRGLPKGAADIVTAMSGGTSAIITGLYDRLIGSIRAVDPALIVLGFTLVRLIHTRWGHAQER